MNTHTKSFNCSLLWPNEERSILVILPLARRGSWCLQEKSQEEVKLDVSRQMLAYNTRREEENKRRHEEESKRYGEINLNDEFHFIRDVPNDEVLSQLARNMTNEDRIVFEQFEIREGKIFLQPTWIWSKFSPKMEVHGTSHLINGNLSMIHECHSEC